MRDHPTDTITLAPMDYVRGALENALHSGLTLDDVCSMAANADTPDDFDHAVNMLAQAVPQDASQAKMPFDLMLDQSAGIAASQSGRALGEKHGAILGRFVASLTIAALVIFAIYQAWAM
jgi:hypothetical protein